MSDISPSFVTDIKNWITLDDQYRETLVIGRQIKKQKNKLSSSILSYMANNGIQNKDINVSDGKLRYHAAKRQSAVSRKHIVNSLAMFFKGDYAKAQEATEFIYNNRESTERVLLKRTVRKSKT